MQNTSQLPKMVMQTELMLVIKCPNLQIVFYSDKIFYTNSTFFKHF